MRLTPRPHPELRINPKCRIYGQYDERANVIEFGRKCKREKDIIGTLIHELQHWTTWQYLTLKEIANSDMPNCNKDYDKYSAWIPEYVSLAVEKLVMDADEC